MSPTTLLAAFLQQAQHEKTILPSHISLYMAILKCWTENNHINPVSITRTELMKSGKINAKATYHKCLKDLHQLGYITYQPSYHPLKGSQIYLNPP